jgi:Ecdysteroid kinase-like family
VTIGRHRYVYVDPMAGDEMVDDSTAPGTGRADSQVTLPKHPDDVTPEWLTSALRSHGLDVTVGSFRREAVGEGLGMMSGLERLEMEYASGHGPSVLILKMPARNDANRAVAEAFDLYAREVLFYRDVAPRSAAWTPTVYHADIDGGDFVLLLEDLSDYRLGDQVEGCAATEARLGMEWLGEHHASFWDDVEDPTLDFLPYVSPSYSSEALQQGCASGWDVMVETFGAVLPDHIRSLKERYLRALPQIFEWMATPPLTVIHGDFRMDNLFFGTSAEQEPLIAIDWQGCLRGRAAQDIGYFMSGSLPIEVRRAHERELIGLWHQHLVDHGVTGFSAEDAWENYRRGVLYVWTLAVVIAGTLDPTNERGHLWMSEMLRRSVATIEDLGLIDLLDEFERPSSATS